MNSAYFFTGLIAGFILNTFVTLHLSWRFAVKLQQSNWIEHFSADLESRRAANDFKREEVVRSDAGPPGNEHNLFPVRPGSHVLNRLSEKRPKKLTKGVDRQADSATLMESGSNTDQTIAKG